MLKVAMLLKKFLITLFVLSMRVNSLDSICHRKCHCLKSSSLIQCSDMRKEDFSTFKGGMLWVKKAVFTSSHIDSDLVSAVFRNVERVVLHNCNILKCVMLGCPNYEIPTVVSDVPTNRMNLPEHVNVKSEQTISDVEFKLKTESFETAFSVFHMQATSDVSSRGGESTVVEYVLISTLTAVTTLVAVCFFYCLYRCYKRCTLKKRNASARKKTGGAKNGSDSNLSENVEFTAFVNERATLEIECGTTRSGRRYAKNE